MDPELVNKAKASLNLGPLNIRLTLGGYKLFSSWKVQCNNVWKSLYAVYYTRWNYSLSWPDPGDHGWLVTLLSQARLLRN